MLHSFNWAMFCSLYGFWVFYLTKNGYSAAECGTITTLVALISIATQPVFGYLADTYLPAKYLCILLCAAAIPLTALVPVNIENHLLITLLIPILSAFDYSLATIMESWTLNLKKSNPFINFFVARSGGSILYAITAVVVGQLLLKSYLWMFAAHILFLVCIIAVAVSLPAYPCQNRRAQDKGGSRLTESILELLKNKPYVMFIISVFFFHAATRVTETYLGLHVDRVGGSSGQLGVALFISAFCEAPIMYLASYRTGKTGRFQGFLLFTSVLGAAYIGILLFANSMTVLYFMLVLRAFSVGGLLVCFGPYITGLVPSRINSFAITAGASLALGLGSVMGNLCGGTVITAWGINTYIFVSLLFMLTSLALFLLALRRKRQAT